MIRMIMRRLQTSRECSYHITFQKKCSKTDSIALERMSLMISSSMSKGSRQRQVGHNSTSFQRRAAVTVHQTMRRAIRSTVVQACSSNSSLSTCRERDLLHNQCSQLCNKPYPLRILLLSTKKHPHRCQTPLLLLITLVVLVPIPRPTIPPLFNSRF